MTIDILGAILLIILGFVMGFQINAMWWNKPVKVKKAGNMIVDTTNPEKDVFSFELIIPITEMIDSDEISFTVVKDEDL